MRSILVLVIFMLPVILVAQRQLEVVFQLSDEDDTRLENFKFYVGASQDSLHYPSTYHLIDLVDGKNSFKTQRSSNGFLFFGTDSLSNISGAFDGALDPINGMYWTWNTGFINLKVEGVHQTNSIEWHIGGYEEKWKTSSWYNYTVDDGEDRLLIQIDLSDFLSNCEQYGKVIMRPSSESHEIFNAFISSMHVE